MHPDYAARAAPPGSVAYLQLLFTPPVERPTVSALFALHAAIREAVVRPLDAAVARIRLAWWRDEIARLLRGDPRHPVTQELARAAPQLADAYPCLNDLLDAAETDLAGVAFSDLTALADYARASTAPVYRLAALAHHRPARHKTALAAADALGAGIRLAGIVRDVRRNALAGRIYLPLATLDHAQALALIDGHAAPEIEAAWRGTHALATSRLDAARLMYGALPPDAASAIALEWHSAMLAAIARGGFRRVRDPAGPGPLRTVWLAWRAARRAAGRSCT